MTHLAKEMDTDGTVKTACGRRRQTDGVHVEGGDLTWTSTRVTCRHCRRTAVFGSQVQREAEIAEEVSK
jgi:hypothetical protein